MREWYAAALGETFRDAPHEEEMLQVGSVTEDFTQRSKSFAGIELREIVPGLEELIVQPRLRRAGFRLPVIVPSRERRHRHQDRLRAAPRLQPEQGASIIEQIEFDIAAAPIQLEVALALGPGLVPPALHDRHVRGQKMIADAAQQS